MRSYALKIIVSKSAVYFISKNIDGFNNDLISLESLKPQLIQSGQIYESLCREYLQYLCGQTADSLNEVERMSNKIREFTERFSVDLQRMNNYIRKIQGTQRDSDSERGSQNTGDSDASSELSTKIHSSSICSETVLIYMF